MRIVPALLLLTTLAGVAFGSDWSAVSPPAPEKPTYPGDGASDLREGGEDFDTAIAIGALPFADSGATCDNTADIDTGCSGGALGRDVVYAFTASAAVNLDVSLCGSGYDTALGIYNSSRALIVCNDDFCGLRSGIHDVAVASGETIYIVVDGYRGACGSYAIDVAAVEPCAFECPVTAVGEGEPDCHDGYDDAYNGGCGAAGWLEVCPQGGTSAVLCGTSGTYNGGVVRDTDWMQAWGSGGTLSATVEAEFPVQLLFIYGTNCGALQYDTATGDPCTPATLSRTVGAGVPVWLWVGPSQFGGVPCGSKWVLTVDGISAGGQCEPTAIAEGMATESWSVVKEIFRQ